MLRLPLKDNKNWIKNEKDLNCFLAMSRKKSQIRKNISVWPEKSLHHSVFIQNRKDGNFKMNRENLSTSVKLSC